MSQQAALSARLDALARLAAAPGGAALGGRARRRSTRQRAVADLAGIARDDLDRLTRYDATADRLTARQEAAARARRELVELRSAVDTERAQIAAQAERRRTLLSEVREDRATHERLAGELADAARRLEALVRNLARRAPAQRAVARATPTPAPGPARRPRAGAGPAPVADRRPRRDRLRAGDAPAVRHRDRPDRHRHRGAPRGRRSARWRREPWRIAAG